MVDTQLKANVLPNSVFVHCEKTGGTFIRENFNERDWWVQLGSGHMGGAEVAELYPAHFRFCFVRHPVSWLRSYWRFVFRRVRYNPEALEYLAAGEDSEAAVLAGDECVINRCWSVDLNRFAAAVLETSESAITRRMRRFIEGCDAVGKQETLNDDLVRFMAQAGESFDLSDIATWTRRNDSHGCPSQKFTMDMASDIIIANKEFCREYGYISVPSGGVQW